MFWEFEEEFWMEMDSEFNQAEFTWTNDESFAPLPLLQTEQPKEDESKNGQKHGKRELKT